MKGASLKHAQKAYKLLALEHNLSNNQAKDLIDSGRVCINNKRLHIARALLHPDTKFTITPPKKPIIIFEDEQILAIDKPPFVTSQSLLQSYPNWALLHRLDKDTSGVLLLIKPQSPFHLKAKECFKKEQVYKEYLAIVEGIVATKQDINAPLLIEKKSFAKASVNPKGQRAQTTITPIEIHGKKTKLKITITTGKTHQIRAHLAHIHHPIIGDYFYGGKHFVRMMLHAHKIALLDYEFHSPIPQEFQFNHG